MKYQPEPKLLIMWTIWNVAIVKQGFSQISTKCAFFKTVFGEFGIFTWSHTSGRTLLLCTLYSSADILWSYSKLFVYFCKAKLMLQELKLYLLILKKFLKLLGFIFHYNTVYVLPRLTCTAPSMLVLSTAGSFSLPQVSQKLSKRANNSVIVKYVGAIQYPRPVPSLCHRLVKS